MTKCVSWLRRRTPSERAEHLQQMGDVLHRRSSCNRFTRLTVCWCEAAGKFCATVDDNCSKSTTFSNHIQCERYIRKYYTHLLFEGSGAPDDIFMDSLGQVTKGDRKG